MPIEDGLSRLLAHWNYGLTKQPGSEHIQEVFLGSKRVDPKDLPILTPTANPQQDSEPRQAWGKDSETLAAFTEESSDEEYVDDQFSQEFEEEGLDDNQETFTEDMLQDDLPPKKPRRNVKRFGKEKGQIILFKKT